MLRKNMNGVYNKKMIDIKNCENRNLNMNTQITIAYNLDLKNN